MDIEDLPLNVSREILQENRILANVKDQSVKKILSELEKLLNSDREKYIKFYKLFGKVLKEGLYGFSTNKDEILKLCLFKSSLRDELITLKEYKDKMPKDQKSIYFISGQNENMLKNSPLIESFKAKNIEVLICDEEIDTIVMPMAGEFDKTPIKPVNNSDVDSEIKNDDSEQNADILGLCVKIKEILKDNVKDVKISSRLSDSAACLIYDKNDPDYATQMIFKQMGHNAPEIKPILEINPNHEIFAKLKDNEIMINDISHLLLGMAQLSEGIAIDNPSEFAKKLTKIMIKAI